MSGICSRDELHTCHSSTRAFQGQFTAPADIQTLPLWIFANLFRPNQAPIVNVVGTVLIVASIIPIYLSQRLSGDVTGGRL
jgi:putative spermidine/putrescine transport system permease protein